MLRPTLRALTLLAPLAACAAAQELSLVETTPVETTLGSDAIPETHAVWLEMIESAEDTLHLAFFYASNEAGSRLEAVIAALEAAADRGVRVRLLSDAKFQETYPDTLARLDARGGIEVRLYDLSASTGGVLHAKYFVVDGREAYVGSANFDYRALEHIQELGLRVRVPALARELERVFALDWRLAGGEVAPADAHAPAGEPGSTPDQPVAATFDGQPVRARLLASPESLLPPGVAWDLPELVAAIDAAEEEVRLQLLSYSTSNRDRTYFEELDNALRAAATRGVRVKLLLADWSKRAWSIEALKSLAVLRDVEVRLITVPQAARGFVPFARVVHAKYLVVDGRRSWLGTSNWGEDYFRASRNVGLLVEGEALGAALVDFHERTWASQYAETVEPGKEYAAPRIGD